MKKVYILVETYEDASMIREFQIFGVYADIDKARLVMDSIIEEDAYGMIAKNGVNERTPNYFETNFCDGFLEYYVGETEIE